jgi:hypothetical protein
MEEPENIEFDFNALGLVSLHDSVTLHDADSPAAVYVAQAYVPEPGAQGDDRPFFLLETVGSVPYSFDPMYTGYTGPFPVADAYTWENYGTDGVLAAGGEWGWAARSPGNILLL